MLEGNTEKPTTVTTNSFLEVNYTNTNLMPTQDHRQIKISFKDENLKAVKEINALKLLKQRVMTIVTKRNTAKLVISGNCRQEKLLSGTSGIKQSLGSSGGSVSSQNRQIRICNNDNDHDDVSSSDHKIAKNDMIKVTGGCNMQIDSLTITIESPSSSSTPPIRKEAEQQGRIVIPQAYINRYGLNVANLENLGSSGLVVYGVASVDAYNHVLKQIRFTYILDTLNNKENLERTLKVMFFYFAFGKFLGRSKLFEDALRLAVFRNLKVPFSPIIL